MPQPVSVVERLSLVGGSVMGGSTVLLNAVHCTLREDICIYALNNIPAPPLLQTCLHLCLATSGSYCWPLALSCEGYVTLKFCRAWLHHCAQYRNVVVYWTGKGVRRGVGQDHMHCHLHDIMQIHSTTFLHERNLF